MSQDYHQGIFSFLNGFDRSSHQEQEQEQDQPQQQIIPRDNKMRLQGFHPPPPPLVAIEEEVESNGLPAAGYETTGMLSEMFNFTSGSGASTPLAVEFPTTTTTDWYGNRMVVGGGGLGPLDESKDHNNHHQTQISGINSAVAMQLFLTNPQPAAARSPSPSPSSHHHQAVASSSTPHMLLPNPSPTSTLQHHHPFGPSQQFPWVNQDRYSQGLSLSLSSSLQAGNNKIKQAADLRLGESGMLFFNQGGEGHHQPLHMDHNNLQQMGYESSLGIVNGLRNSKYSKAAQELLQEFCSIGSRGHQLKKQFIIKQETNNNPNPNNNNKDNPNPNPSGTVGGKSSSSSKEPPHMSSADRLEHQRRKVKLLSMLDEVDRRYNHYREQMQMVVNSFDLMMGFGAAVPYTALAQKAMSRHFRCLKDAIATQLKQSCELLGEKDPGGGTSGVTKGETPRLKLLEQSLRQQRAFHQMGMMEQETWRPQRGLPERSINILRAWLFEHFLHPYPSDADKHLLARQTGLSRNQVSNWFINARVRLWKPMVEEMYQQEAKEEEDDDEEEQEREINPNNNNNNNAQTPMQDTTGKDPIPLSTAATGERSEFNDYENDPSLIALNRQHPTYAGTTATTLMPPTFPLPNNIHDETSGSNELGSSTFIRFGKSAGDVSLTLGLHHTGNLPDNGNNFAVTDFGGF